MQDEKCPKVELHVHLDGSLRVETVLELAKERRIVLPTDDPEQLRHVLSTSQDCHDLQEYLQCFDLPLAILQDEESLERTAYELVADLAAEGVVYAEIRYAPLLHVQKQLKPTKVVEAVLRGVNRGKEAYGIEITLLLCCMRHQDIVINKDVVRLAADFLGGGVVGIDLAGDEKNYPVRKMEELFVFAQSAHLPYTIHAGEADGAASIGWALAFGASRIGHGVHAYEDAQVLSLLKEKNIALEMCLTSNVQTKAVAEIGQHPIDRYYKMGIPVTINTDNRTVSGTTLQQEYQLLSDFFNWQKEDLNAMNLTALEHAFAEPIVKERVRKLFVQRFCKSV